MSAPELAGFAAAKGYALNSARSNPADLLSKDAPASVSKAGRGLRFGLDQIKVSAPVDQYEGLSRHQLIEAYRMTGLKVHPVDAPPGV